MFGVGVMNYDAGLERRCDWEGAGKNAIVCPTHRHPLIQESSAKSPGVDT